MQYSAWEPIYHEILEDFGFTHSRDEEAARLLYELLQQKRQCLDHAARRILGKEVVVAGNAPILKEELTDFNRRSEAVVAADGATAVLLENGIVPEIIATDLDGPFQAILSANRRGSIVAVHAHGDNLDALRRCVPQLDMIIGTVQCKPPEGLYNFGGFTDGDRCVFLARELGAASIRLIGFDFDDESVTPRKKKKLVWARRLIEIALTENPEPQI